MFKKVFIILTVVLLATFGFAKEKIVFWNFMMDEDTASLILDKFEEKNPDIEVEFVQLSWANGFDKIVTAFAAGTAPDVLELGNTWVANFANEGVLTDLSIYKNVRDDIVGWNQVQFNGKYWGFPWLLGTRAMYYNIDLFIQAGLDPENPPKTWSEVLEAAKKIDALGSDVYGMGMAIGEPYSPWQEWFLPAVWGNNGDIMTKNLKTATLNSPEAIEAAQFYKDLSKYALKTKMNDLQAAFGQGKLGMLVTGANVISDTASSYPETNFYVSFVPKPDKGGFSASFAGGEVLTVPKQSKHKEAALRLVKYLVEADVAMDITKRVPVIFPSNSKAAEDPWFEDHPLEQIFLEQNATAVPASPHPKFEDIQSLVSTAVEEIVLDNADIKKTLDKYNTRIQIILDETKW